MQTITEKAFAKLNLTLDVLGKRPDGYHDLKSVMQTVSLHDVVRIRIGTGEAWRLVCEADGIPCDSRNLAWKAAQLYLDTVGEQVDGLEIHIEKHIPSGAGMGGGSADAAAVLRGLNRFYGNRLSLTELADLGAKIGSDVPFCVVGGTVMCEGRGEILTVLKDMPKCVIIGCKPEFSVSTPELYRKIDSVTVSRHPDNDAMEKAIAAQDLAGILGNIYNVFEPVVSESHGEIPHIKGICEKWGALAVQMTGSGSVVFAVMPNQQQAQMAMEELKTTYDQVFLTEPV